MRPLFFAPTESVPNSGWGARAASSPCHADVVARMLRVSIIPTTSGTEDFSGLRDRRIDLQRLLAARACSVQALALRTLHQSDLRGRFRGLLLTSADVRLEAEICTRGPLGPLNLAISSSSQGHLALSKERGQSAGNMVWHCRQQAAIPNNLTLTQHCKPFFR